MILQKFGGAQVPVSLITAEEEALPDDDDAAAFVAKERICREEMNRLLPRYGQNEDDTEVWMEYIIQVRAAAVAYGFYEMVPPMPLGRDEYWKFYEGAVTLAATLARQARRERSSNLVAFTRGDKARLAKYLSELREALEVSGISEKLKENLRRRLDQFEEELGRERSNISRILLAASLVATAVGGSAAAVLAGIERAEDVIIKLPATFDAIAKIAGNAKTEEIERQPEQKNLPPTPKALPSQRGGMDNLGYVRTNLAQEAESFSADLDDEIPF